MKSESLSSEQEGILRKIKTSFYNLLIFPCELGLFGFAFLFTIIIFIKILQFILYSQEFLQVSLADIKISFIGFLALFTFSFIRKIQRR